MEKTKKVTKPRKIDIYEVFCAILYVLKSGCQWRMLPSDFPKWSTVYYYWRIWSYSDPDGSESTWERVLKKIGGTDT